MEVVDLPHLDGERWASVCSALQASARPRAFLRPPPGQRDARALLARLRRRSRSRELNPSRAPCAAWRRCAQEMCTDEVQSSEDLLLSMRQYLPKVVPRRRSLLFCAAFVGDRLTALGRRRRRDGKRGSPRASLQASLPR